MQPYLVGEDVLVESKSGQMLWDASVTAVSKKQIAGPPKTSVIDAYRVDYKGWGKRFTEWVKPDRVVEPNENNRSLQVSLVFVLDTSLFFQFLYNWVSLFFSLFHRRSFSKKELHPYVVFLRV